MRGLSSILKRGRRQDAYERAGGRCSYCHRQVKKAEGTLDHFMPRALGGTSRRSNLRWCCLDCNAAKADMHPSEWMRGLPPAQKVETRAEVKIRLLSEIAKKGRKAA